MSTHNRYRRPTHSVRRRHAVSEANGSSVVAFILVACFGILFVGCGGTEQPPESADQFTFTEEDVARFREMMMTETGSSSVPHLVVDGQDQIDPDQPIILDLSNVDTYSAIRGEGMNGSKDSYRVTNTFLNIRSAPSVTSDNLGRLDKGDEMEIIEFHNAAWAKARLLNGREGFVAIRYIAKVTSEEKLSIEKEKFADQYFVNFGFLNVRKDPDADSEKIGELPGQTIVKPLSVDEVWARIPFDGKDGYVAVQYLKPFLPNFLVRQEKYSLPVLQYDMSREGMSDSLVKHVAKLKEEGVDLMTFRDFSDVLISQQERDVRVGPNTVILSVSGITGENVKEVSDILRASSATATFFIQTNQIGLDGITEKMLQTLLANGNDIQSSGHTGDDLRSLTNSQIELELRQSRQLLEEKIGSTITAVLYPLGGVNSRVEEIAASAGYLFGVGVRPEREVMRDELLMMPSFTILPSMTGQDIITIALGTSEEEPQEE